jgi:fructokinase
LISEPSRSATKAALNIARAGGALISFDVNDRPTLWANLDEAVGIIMEMIPQVTLLKVNETELKILSGSDDLAIGSLRLLEQGPDLCVVTLGADGSYFRVAGGYGHVPPYPVHTVDSVGCGDAFTSGLLCRILDSGNWREQLDPGKLRQNLRYANAVGALTALKKGVIPALPTGIEVDAFLVQQDAE